MYSTINWLYALEETGGTLRNLLFIQKVMTSFVLKFDYKLAEIVNMRGVGEFYSVKDFY